MPSEPVPMSKREQKAREAAAELDQAKAVEPKAFVLEVGAAEVEAAAAKQAENSMFLPAGANEMIPPAAGAGPSFGAVPSPVLFAPGVTGVIHQTTKIVGHNPFGVDCHAPIVASATRRVVPTG